MDENRDEVIQRIVDLFDVDKKDAESIYQENTRQKELGKQEIRDKVELLRCELVEHIQVHSGLLDKLWNISHKK